MFLGKIRICHFLTKLECIFRRKWRLVMSNEHIRKFLDEYLAKPSNDYAVLITGCWGSGKTYFVSQYMGGKKVHKVRDWLMDSVSR